MKYRPTLNELGERIGREVGRELGLRYKLPEGTRIRYVRADVEVEHPDAAMPPIVRVRHSEIAHEPV